MQPQKRRVLHYVADGKDLFGEWLQGLKDISGRAAILNRIDKEGYSQSLPALG